MPRRESIEKKKFSLVPFAKMPDKPETANEVDQDGEDDNEDESYLDDDDFEPYETTSGFNRPQ